MFNRFNGYATRGEVYKREVFKRKLVHMVLVGPFALTSVSQGRYILTFIDDFSRYTWVYFLHNKNEVLDKFLDFKTHVE